MERNIQYNKQWQAFDVQLNSSEVTSDAQNTITL